MTLFGEGKGKGRRDERERGGREKYLARFRNKAAKNRQELITNRRSVKGNVGFNFHPLPSLVLRQKIFLASSFISSVNALKINICFQA